MGLTGCYACMKYLVVIFNLIFWLTGIGVLAVSIWLYFDSSVYLGNTDGSYMYFVAIFVLMAAGAIMFLIGLLGCCGALQESPCMLGTFFIFLLMIFAAEITGGVWAWMYKDEVNKIIEMQITKMVKDEYGASKSVENTIDAVQREVNKIIEMQVTKMVKEEYGVSKSEENNIEAFQHDVNKIIEMQVTKMVKDEYGASKSAEKTIDAVQRDVNKLIESQVTKMVKDEYGASKSVEKTIDAVQHHVNKIIEKLITKMVKDEYGASKSVENTIDAVQHDLHCCGAMTPSDWAHSRLNSNDKSAVEVGISKTSGFYIVPATCCKTRNPDECDLHRKVRFAGQVFDGIYTEGCIPRLQRYFEDNMIIMVGIGIGVGVIQLLGLTFSMALCCAIRSE